MPNAIVIACLRSHILIEDEQGARHCAHYPKLVHCVCGDRVSFELASSSVQIVSCEERQNLLTRKRNNNRPNQNIASNVSSVIIVIDINRINTELIDSYLIACAAWDAKACLLFNKIDVQDLQSNAQEIISSYRSLDQHYVLEASMKSGEGVADLEQALTKETAIMVGLSGAGKTSLVNRLIPDLDARVAEISEGSQEGKHTTTEIMLHRIPTVEAMLIDSPGVRSYHYPDLSLETIAAGYSEFYPYLDSCRYPNCKHLKEPDCGVKQALSDGKIVEFRYRNYCKFVQEATR